MNLQSHRLALPTAVNPGSSISSRLRNDGWLDMYSTKSAISAQAVSWFDKLQPPSSHLQPPGACRAFHLAPRQLLRRSPVPRTWRTTYSKLQSMAHWRQGSKLPTPLLRGDVVIFCFSRGSPCILLRSVAPEGSSFTSRMADNVNHMLRVRLIRAANVSVLEPREFYL